MNPIILKSANAPQPESQSASTIDLLVQQILS